MENASLQSMEERDRAQTPKIDVKWRRCMWHVNIECVCSRLRSSSSCRWKSRCMETSNVMQPSDSIGINIPCISRLSRYIAWICVFITTFIVIVMWRLIRSMFVALPTRWLSAIVSHGNYVRCQCSTFWTRLRYAPTNRCAADLN